MPIAKLTDALDKIAEGDFDVRMNIRSSEEINKLVDAVERMQNSFAVAYRRLKAKTHQLEVLESEKKEVDEVFESKGVTKIKLKSAV
jgi:nitrate/nitrite-specific signal transduction histidine kinase